MDLEHAGGLAIGVIAVLLLGWAWSCQYRSSEGDPTLKTSTQREEERREEVRTQKGG